MKTTPKIVQTDSRGQVVIPKHIRSELKIEAGSGFFVYLVGCDSFLLKRIPFTNIKNKDILRKIKAET